ncbi:uncharacterized protein TNIN_273221 [Trichonephila inaurata madagascariensis]|uniref:Conotoxin n=1 Tax=Trichonephila inaurata madagascariensis TaxID=2747483 RepID=A0A8X6IIJ6_9ARAC|nr:uncharacterized protein TNIN_273221 [Trichonephila inaurata madagascariensis]
MMMMRSCLLVLVAACCLLVVSGEKNTPPDTNFVSSLISRVRETEPREIREYRTSCIREPGCSWKCSEDVHSHCQCVCGSQKRKKNGSKNRKSTA